MSPAGVGAGSGRKRRANSPYQATTPGFHTLVRRCQPASAIAMKACPGLRSGLNSRPSFRHWYENTLKRLLSTRANPFIRHSREGGNPRTNIPRKNASRDTTNQWLNFHTLVCRLEPARAIGTKMMLRGFRARQRIPTFVIPAKAGIHALTFRKRTSTAIPPPTSTRRPHFVFPARDPPNPDTVPKSSGVGRGECSAVEDYARRGACLPLGRRRGVAESAAPTRRTQPQLRLFIPWSAGGSRHERLVRKHVPESDPG